MKRKVQIAKAYEQIADYVKKHKVVNGWFVNHEDWFELRNMIIQISHDIPVSWKHTGMPCRFLEHEKRRELRAELKVYALNLMKGIECQV